MKEILFNMSVVEQEVSNKWLHLNNILNPKLIKIIKIIKNILIGFIKETIKELRVENEFLTRKNIKLQKMMNWNRFHDVE